MAPQQQPAEKRRRGALARALRGALIAATVLVCGLAVLVAWTWASLKPLSLTRAEALSVTVLDRSDRLLRAYTSPDGYWRLPVEVKDVDPRYLAMLIAFEDKRFRRHHGVDPLAIGRAGWLLLRHRRPLSGGSTLTMQVARLLLGVHERSLPGKIRQALLALQLDWRLSKTEILALYLRLAPFGGNLEGVRAASLAYFGKEPRRLSVGEAALLVAIPQSPGTRRPDRVPMSAKRARNHVLARMLAAGVISREDAMRAMAERVPTTRREFPMLAPHLGDYMVEQHKTRVVHRLTLDYMAQANVEQLVRDYAGTLGGKLSAAVVVVDHRTGEVIAQVGSPGLLDEDRFGAVDMTSAIRSPGSTLKPIIYGLAFELGLAHPETLIEDRPSRFGIYVPKNFDHDWHGTVSIRTALIQSLNIPAVKVLEQLGAGRLYTRLQQAGVNPVLPQGTDPSLAMALGGLGLRLTDLAQLYATLAHGGEPIVLKYRRDVAPPKGAVAGQRLLSQVAAWYVADILCQALPPANAKPGLLCYKTGTSYGFRDAWSVGFDGRYVVAVWVGRPDGASTPGLTGRATAAPLLFDAFARIAARRTPMQAAPSGALRVANADLPPPLKRFREGATDDGAAGGYLEPAVKISFPPDRSEIEVEGGESTGVVVKAEGGVLPLTWLLDGEPIASDPQRRDVELPAGGRGFFKLAVIDARGRADRVSIRLK
ncbi:MAG TPA: penicillin-binding protein 1C [Hyphomicrobiaceae bacterium]|nr:penicillin-binding protein 1C [Hyphomicrobiaceae bacterium]